MLLRKAASFALSAHISPQQRHDIHFATCADEQPKVCSPNVTSARMNAPNWSGDLKMKLLIALAGLSLLSACGREAGKPGQELPLWQSVGLMLNASDDEAEALVTSVLAKHNLVASDTNVKEVIGGALIFRDQDKVDVKRVLTCMDSGVRSPTGSAWQDTMAYCVTELGG